MLKGPPPSVVPHARGRCTFLHAQNLGLWVAFVRYSVGFCFLSMLSLGLVRHRVLFHMFVSSPWLNAEIRLRLNNSIETSFYVLLRFSALSYYLYIYIYMCTTPYTFPPRAEMAPDGLSIIECVGLLHSGVLVAGGKHVLHSSYAGRPYSSGSGCPCLCNLQAQSPKLYTATT